jgi:hypothetical protein
MLKEFNPEIDTENKHLIVIKDLSKDVDEEAIS